MEKTKQCAGCGAQMGARSRVCPRCGRGSLFGELGLIALLGVLLLGIGIASGVVRLDTVRKEPGTRASADTARAAREARPRVPTTAARRPRGIRREARGAESLASPARVDSQTSSDILTRILAVAPCSVPDTEMIRNLLQQSGPLDEQQIAAKACTGSLEAPVAISAESAAASAAGLESSAVDESASAPARVPFPDSLEP